MVNTQERKYRYHCQCQEGNGKQLYKHTVLRETFFRILLLRNTCHDERAGCGNRSKSYDRSTDYNHRYQFDGICSQRSSQSACCRNQGREYNSKTGTEEGHKPRSNTHDHRSSPFAHNVLQSRYHDIDTAGQGDNIHQNANT